MTRHEKRLAKTLHRQIEGLNPEQIVERLFLTGFINIKACEQKAVCEQIEQHQKEGLPRCEAMHATAELFCCSYEKIRNYYYNSYKR